MGFFGDLIRLIFGGRDEPPPAPIYDARGDRVGGLVVAMNAQRVDRGLSGLTRDARLDALASAWAAEMARSGQLGHGDFSGRVARLFPNVPTSENVAEGYPDAPAVVDGWMGSFGHRANLLGPYRLVGVGEATDGQGRRWWCADFAG